MNYAVQETICSQCKHHDICKYCERVITAELAAREINSRQNVYSPVSVKVVCTRREISYASYREDNECKL